MKLTLSTSFTFIASVYAAVAPHSRSLSPDHGTIFAPTSGSTVAPSSSVAFSYRNSDWCHDGYSGLTIWLTDYLPGALNINSDTGVVSPSTLDFGTFTQPNFGLPPIPSSQVPSSLTIPDLSDAGVAAGDAIYLTVVEKAADCPPGNQPPQYAWTTVQLTYT